MNRRYAVVFGAFVALAPATVVAPAFSQDPSSPPAQESPANEPAASDQPAAESGAAGTAAEQFRTLYDEWRNLLTELRDLKEQATSAPAEQRAEAKQRYEALLEQGHQLLPQLRDAALAAYLEAPNQDRQLTRMLAQMASDALSRDQHEAAFQLAQPLIEHDSGIREAYKIAGIAAFALHEFEAADKYFEQARVAGTLDADARRYADVVDQYKTLWQAEQQKRAQEAEQDDLPRVRLQTTEGDIVVELFENEAPGTVGNFIYLVEQGFYDGVSFHRVLPNFMAQTGDPKGDGTGGPGYTIYSETNREGARMHFRGSLSMANTGQPNSGGSQFFITFLPTPHLNGRHTVFGRVLEGWDVLAKLQRRDPSSRSALPEPDRIVKAEVLRKRDHQYLPNRVE